MTLRNSIFYLLKWDYTSKYNAINVPRMSYNQAYRVGNSLIQSKLLKSLTASHTQKKHTISAVAPSQTQVL